MNAPIRSILNLLKTITDNPFVDTQTRTRAGFLLSRMSGAAS
jgi:hypothetical protein